MGIVRTDAINTSVISYVGIVLGYINRVFLFVALLSDDQIGLINLILSIALLFSQLANFGSLNSLWRFFPNIQNESNGHYGFLKFNLLIALIGSILVSLIFLIFQTEISNYYSENSKMFTDYLGWVIPSGMAILLYRLLDTYTRALYKSVFSMFANNILLRLFTSLILVLYAFKLFDFTMLVAWMCIIQWLPGILLLFYLGYLNELNLIGRSIIIPRKMKRIILKYSGYSYLNSIGASVVMSIDTLMVAGMLGLDATGVYTTMLFVSRALTIPYESIMRISGPLIPAFWKDKAMDKMNDLYAKVTSVSLIIGLYFFLGFWACRTDLMRIVPDMFQDGMDVFLFIMIGKIIDMAFGLNGTILITSAKYRWDVLFTSVLIVLVIVLNLWMIPIYGMIGAAVSTAIAYLLYNLARYLFVFYHYQLNPFRFKQLYTVLLFGAILAFVEFIPIRFNSAILSILFNGSMVSVLFLGGIYVLKLQDEINDFADKILRRIRRK